MTMKQLESLSPPIMKQVLPLVDQLPSLYMDLVKGREDFSPKPEETRRIVSKSPKKDTFSGLISSLGIMCVYMYIQI